MVKFLRKIRFNFIRQKRTGDYLIFAIVEIFLVVLGILIAFQINNWNENRKLQNEELNLLADIRLNLIANINNFKNDSLINQSDIYLYEKIEYYIENDLEYNSELDSAFGVLTFWTNPYITATAYNSLQTKGLDLIKNEQLRKEIVKIYEIDLKTLIEDYVEGEKELSHVVMPYFSKNMRRLHNESLFLSRPNDFENLKQSDEFKNILSMVLRQHKRGQEFLADAMRNMNNLIDSIEIEISSR